jgi:hypothetical protein
MGVQFSSGAVFWGSIFVVGTSATVAVSVYVLCHKKNQDIDEMQERTYGMHQQGPGGPQLVPQQQFGSQQQFVPQQQYIPPRQFSQYPYG